MSPLRILVVDDTSLYRKFVRELLADLPDAEVIGVAANGRLALQAIDKLQPDLVTLDIEMPELDGLSVLAEVKRRRLPVGVIMLSSLTTQGADRTMLALRQGAFDFVPKPSTSNLQQSLESLQAELIPKIEAFRRSRGTPLTTTPAMPSRPAAARRTPGDRIEMVTIGVSTGGPSTLAHILSQLPADFPVPIVIVQHMPPIFTRSLANDLNRICALEVREAEQGTPLLPGQVLIAPGGRHLRLVRAGLGTVAQVTDDPAERSCKPSVDYLFRSVAAHYGPRALALILTGMGDDGVIGCQTIKQRGGTVLAQDQESCVVFGMPRAVIEQGLADEVLPLPAIAPFLIRAVSGAPVALPV